jgi:hypothetical protein
MMEETRVKLKNKSRRRIPGETLAKPVDPPARVVVVKQNVARHLLDRLDASKTAPASPDRLALPAPAQTAPAEQPFQDRWNAALGCRTNEVALTLLAQITELIEPRFDQASEGSVDTVLSSSTARVAELEPQNATEALLAVQMVGAQWAAMKFLARSMADG